MGLLLVAGALCNTGCMAKVMFSETSGVVLDHGEPVVGAKIDRSYLWVWNNAKHSDSTVTDASGRFRLPELTATSLTSLFPHEPIVRQKITISHNGTSYDAWETRRRNYEVNGERPGGKKVKLRCELSAAPAEYRPIDGSDFQTYDGIAELVDE